MKIKVAAIQTKTFLEANEQKKNIERAWEYVAEAATQEATFICFPENSPAQGRKRYLWPPHALESKTRRFARLASSGGVSKKLSRLVSGNRLP